MTTIYICGSTQTVRWRVSPCPTCEFDAVTLYEYSDSAYWGTIITCTSCGDQWDCGDLVERPFRRGWQQERIARAAALFEQACECPVQWDGDCMLVPCEHDEARA